jgi:large subunit ribosomal protein L31
MSKKVHENYKSINVSCSCGNKFITRSMLGKDLSVDVCCQCHPFYTGKQKLVDTQRRVDKFMQKYKNPMGSSPSAAKDN